MFFPIRDNDQNLFDEDVWKWQRDEITRIVSGFTELGVVVGWWEGQFDQNKWIVAVVENMEIVDQLRIFLQKARHRFRQDAMYFEWHPVRFELVK